MNNERVIPNNSTYDYVSFDVLSNGSPIDESFQIISATVTKEVNRIPTAKLIIRDGDAALEDFEISNEDVFAPGAELEIKSGRDGDNSTIFKGIIVKHGIKVSESGISQLCIEAKDKSIKMCFGRKNKYFEDSKDSEILEEILGEYGLKGKVDATKAKHKEVVQYHSTDWDFLMSRAEVNGLLVMPNDGKVDIKAPDTSSAPVLNLVYGGNLLSFEAEMNAQNQWASVAGSAWDYSNQALFESESTSAKFKENGNIDGKKLSEVIGLKKFELRHSGQLKTEELQAWTDAAILKSRLAKIRGNAKFIGYADIKVGDTVKLQGVGDRFNGTAYVTAIRQELLDGAWFTHAQFGLDPKWFIHKKDIVEPDAAGLLPGIKGLQIGKVVQLEGDPEGDDRILVKLPIIDNAAKGVWTRLASLDAGQNRGWVIRPEIDDEVIIGFINGDPRDSVALGMLHSSAKPAPIDAKDDNHEKGYVTRSEMKVLFDDEKKIITIETPAGNSIVISEEDKAITITDQNKNKAVMEPAGITMKSPKDINIEADGNINIKATMNLAMEGLNVNGKAKTALKMEGSASAELNGGGTAIVKGGMVMIN